MSCYSNKNQVDVLTGSDMKPEFINIAAYKFVDLDDLAGRKSTLLPLCRTLGLKGTILLSHEGINMFLAGERESIGAFLAQDSIPA